jgi:hypothetical protein
MLIESILHLLAEEGLISKEKVLEAINGLVELAHEEDRTRHGGSAVKLLEAIAQTFAAKGSDEVMSPPVSMLRLAGSSKGADEIGRSQVRPKRPIGIVPKRPAPIIAVNRSSSMQ